MFDLAPTFGHLYLKRALDSLLGPGSGGQPLERKLNGWLKQERWVKTFKYDFKFFNSWQRGPSSFG